MSDPTAVKTQKKIDADDKAARQAGAEHARTTKEAQEKLKAQREAQAAKTAAAQERNAEKAEVAAAEREKLRKTRLARQAKGTATFFASPGQEPFDIDVKVGRRAAPKGMAGLTLSVDMAQATTKAEALSTLDAIRRNIENADWPR